MKNIIAVIIVLLSFGCQKDPEINDIVRNKKITAQIDKFVEDLGNGNPEKFIMVSGISIPKEKRAEILFTNNKPVVVKENFFKREDDLENGRYGYFKYKGYEFLVYEKLKDIFQLDYKDFNRMKEHFIIKDHYPSMEEAMKQNWKIMYVKYDMANDSVDLSRISEMSMPGSAN